MSDEPLTHIEPEPPAYNEEQLNTAVVLERINLARKMFYFLAAAFSIVLAAALFSIFSGWGSWPAIVGLMTTDSLLGVAFLYMVRYLFPQSK